MRIGLLTPYTGTNLGDGAIQTAVIAGLRNRLPGVEFLGITLDPAETTRRHGIPAVPIMGLFVPFYSNALFVRNHSPSESRHCPQGVRTIEPSRILRALVKRLVPSARTWATIPTELRHLRNAWKTVHQLNLLLISGGGQLDEEFGGPWGHPYAMYVWTALARRAGVPVAFASVGAQSLRHPLTRTFVRSALGAAAYRSYRDPGTQQAVSGWPFTALDLHVPDLAFSLPLSPSHFTDLRNGPRLKPYAQGARIGISPIAYGHPTLWPTRHPGVYRRYLHTLARSCSWLIQQGAELVLFHSSGSDKVAISDLVVELEQIRAPSQSLAIRRPQIVTVDDFLREIAGVDLVVASRLHGILMSHILRKPVLAISFDRKVDAHMNDLGQSSYTLGIETFNVEQLTERFVALSQEAAPQCEFIDRKVRECQAAVEKQYDTVARLCRG